jgi:superfamily I DNA/RNA helicase
VFLHPSQRDVVDRDFSGPARVTGTAGTGKTIVALHRAARAVREDAQARVLLTSFSRPLANALHAKLAILLADDPGKLARVSIASFEDAASELFQLATGRRPTLAPIDAQQAALERAIADLGYTDLSPRFVISEWRQIVDAWNLPDVGSYAKVPRIGRRNRLGSKQRETLWPVFEATRRTLAARGFVTSSQLFAVVEADAKAKADKPFTHVIVDEAQDLGVAELRMIGALATGPNAHFFAGDLGQRIFQLPFSWLTLGVDVRGRSSSLRINYRTSRQIREAADQLLPPKVRDVDGIEDDRTGAQSVFEGPAPTIVECADEADEAAKVAAYLRAAIDDGISAAEIGIFVRSAEYLPRCRAAVAAAGLEARQLTERAEGFGDCVSLGTMHLAKGLEFKAVIVMACDDEALPLQSRVDEATDEDELREVFETERHLFYVACTRARDRLYLTGVMPTSDFFEDMRAGNGDET